MAARNSNGTTQKPMNRGAWTAEEDMKLVEYIEVHGAKRWKTVAIRAGLKRSGKSCRLRWLNYLRPNVKRGNISEEEEDLIIRLHKLLGNRWSLIAGRLPNRTDNEIKNYWNSHLSKKINQDYRTPESSTPKEATPQKIWSSSAPVLGECSKDANEFFVFSMEESFMLEWVNEFLQLDEDSLLI